MAHSDLIAKLEAAESGSRELDLEIWGNHVAIPRSPRPWKLNVTPPAYTTSLDAVVALIGEKLPGYEWSVGWDMEVGKFHGATNGISTFWGSTAPLALCIALLRALSTQPVSGEVADG